MENNGDRFNRFSFVAMMQLPANHAGEADKRITCETKQLDIFVLVDVAFGYCINFQFDFNGMEGQKF